MSDVKQNYFNRAPGGMRIAVAAIALAAMTGGAGASGATGRLESLETQAGLLSAQVDELRGALSAFSAVPPAEVAEAPILVAQSSRDVASINVRLGQLEEQIRVLTGQVEGLQFQMTQMQTFLERLQEDYEFRFQQLEGTPSGKTDAAPQSGGGTPSGGLPQNPDFTEGETEFLPSPDIVIDPEAEGYELLAPGEEPFIPGTPEHPLGTLSSEDLQLSGQPLDLNFDSGGLVTEDDASAQYRAGYEAVVRGDYAFAEDQFRQFIGLFPEHPRAPDATNWLGEALILRGEYEEAAEVLLTGFQSYPNSTRAPDLLLKLGIALNGAGELDTACRTFQEVQRRFPDVSPSFSDRLASEMDKAAC